MEKVKCKFLCMSARELGNGHDYSVTMKPIHDDDPANESARLWTIGPNHLPGAELGGHLMLHVTNREARPMFEAGVHYYLEVTRV